MSSSQVKAGENYVEIKVRPVNVAEDSRKAGEKSQKELQQAARQGRQAVANEARRLEQELSRMHRSWSTSQKRIAVEQQQAASSALNRRGQIAMQAAFGFDDAVAGFQTGGMKGAIRGAANNLSMLAMAAGGVKGAMIGIGIAAAAQMAPAIQTAISQADARMRQFERTVESVRSIMDERFSAATRDVNRGFELRDVGGLSSVAQVDDAEQRAQDQIQRLEAQRAAVKENVKSIQAEYGRLADSEAEYRNSFRGFIGALGWDSQGTASEFNEKSDALGVEMEKLERQQREIEAEIAHQQALIGAAGAARGPLQAREAARNALADSRMTAEQRQAHDEAMGRIDRMDNWEQATEAVRALTDELTKLSTDAGLLGRQRELETTDAERQEGERQRTENAIRQRSVSAQIDAARKQAERLGLTAAGRMGLAALDGTPEGERRQIEADRMQARRDIAALPISSEAQAHLLGLNDLQAQRRVATLALQEAARLGGPTIPQVGLEHGTVEAVQQAAANSDASQTTRMADSLQELEDRAREQLELFERFLALHEEI